MRINVIGAGVSGLFFALYLKSRDSGIDIRIWERREADQTGGWGILFQEGAKTFIKAASPVLHERLCSYFWKLPSRRLFFREQEFLDREPYHDTIACDSLIRCLRDACESIGVPIEYGVRVDGKKLDELSESDLLVGADGVESVVRNHWASRFDPKTTLGRNPYIWLAIDKSLEGFRLMIEETEFGPIAAHAFSYSPDRTTCIVELPEDSWRRGRFDQMISNDGSINSDGLSVLTATLQHRLENGNLISRRNRWKKFPQMTCHRWFSENRVLIGDAAHPSFFSKGLGTQIALEDAATLSEILLSGGGTLETNLATFQRKRRGRVSVFQRETSEKNRFFEDLDKVIALPPESLMLLIRSDAAGK